MTASVRSGAVVRRVPRTSSRSPAVDSATWESSARVGSCAQCRSSRTSTSGPRSATASSTRSTASKRTGRDSRSPEAGSAAPGQWAAALAVRRRSGAAARVGISARASGGAAPVPARGWPRRAGRGCRGPRGRRPTGRWPRARRSAAAASATSRVLPTPGSPPTKTSCRRSSCERCPHRLEALDLRPATDEGCPPRAATVAERSEADSTLARSRRSRIVRSDPYASRHEVRSGQAPSSVAV